MVALARAYLERDGYRVSEANDGLRALELARKEQPRLVVLDLMLPGLDGLEVCRRLQVESMAPVIMLTARVEEADRLEGLNLGADDYVTKPFSPRELAARVRAVLRRSDRESAVSAYPELCFGAISVDLRARKATVDGAELGLTPTEFRLLTLLLQEPGRVLSRNEIIDRALGDDFDGFDRAVRHPMCPVFAESSKPKDRGAPGISRPCTAAATGCVMSGAPEVRTGPLRDLVSSLQFRLVTGFALTIVLTLAGAGIFISLSTEMQVERFETDQAMAQAGRVSEFISNYSIENRDPAEPGAGLQSVVRQAADISGLRVTAFDARGNVVADSNPPHISNDMEGEYAPKEAESFPLLSGGEVVGSITASSGFGPEPGTERFAVSDPDVSRIARHVDRYLLWAGIGVALLGTALVWILARRALAPAHRLEAAARRLGRGDLSQRAEVAGPSEIRQLAHSFNSMAAELEEAESRRRSLTADIAHELRTPASNIQGYMEAIKDGVFQPEPETIDTIHEQALLLSRLVEDLRILAQADGGELRLQRTRTRVEELAQSCVDALRPGPRPRE